MGEVEFEPNVMVSAVQSALAERAEMVEQEMRLTTPGGRYQVRWDDNGSASALGQLAFFAEFLDVSGLFERWVTNCPMSYTSPNAPDTKDVPGTWLLSILDGQWRYAHITGLRGDSVAPGILGMNKIVSDESLRRGLKHLAPALERGPEAERPAREAQLAKTTAWMDHALMESIRAALSTGWILDIDTTIKLLYGHQDGAEISYNPLKPGRPTHVIHTYWIANVRLVLDAEVQNGKAHAARHSLPRLIVLLQALPAEERPRLVRGDIAFGVDPVMSELEQMEQAYLFKLKQTTGVKRLIERLWRLLKNQWGWGGYTTQDLERCNLSARAVALIYNWWSWYVRLAHPQTRREAITSRPLLLAGIARLTTHAGQSRLLITLTHAGTDRIKSMIANVRKGLDTILASAPQLPKPDRWRALVRYIISKIVAAREKFAASGPANPPPGGLCLSGNRGK